MVREKSLTAQLVQLSVSLITTMLVTITEKEKPNFHQSPPFSSPSSSSNLQLLSYLAMPVRNQNGVVMGFPADYFETPPRYEEPTITTAAERPLPCNNADEKPHPCVKWLILTLFVITMIFFMLAFSGFYLTYQNKAPYIRIESITPSNINASPNTTISSNWRLTFSVDNPNKFASIHYKKIQVSVFYKDKHLSSGNVDYFYQDEKEEGRMNVDILGLVMNMEKEKMNEADEMVVSLKLDAVVWFETKFMKNHWQLLEANCGDVKVRPSMNLTLDGSGRCNTNLQ